VPAVWITPSAVPGSEYILTSHIVSECIQLLLLELTSALQNPPEDWWFSLFCEYISFMYVCLSFLLPLNQICFTPEDYQHPLPNLVLTDLFPNSISSILKFHLFLPELPTLLQYFSPLALLLTYHMALPYWLVSVKGRDFVCYVQVCTTVPSIQFVLKSYFLRGGWVAQSLSICLPLRSWSQGPGIHPSSGSLLGGKPASPSPTPPACVPSLCLSL